MIRERTVDFCLHYHWNRSNYHVWSILYMSNKR